MIRSMTGFGSAAGLWAGRTVTVELKSVNSRFREVVTRLPRVCAPLEEAVKKQVAVRLERGRVDLWVQLDDRESRPPAVRVDYELARTLAERLNELRERLNLSGAVTLDHLLTLGVVGREEEPAPNLEELGAALGPLVGEAVEALVAMREAEGRNLGRDLVRRLDLMADLNRRVGEAAAGAPEALLTRLTNRLAELGAGLAVDSTRLAQEAALLADRADITEEVVRLGSHLDGFRRLLDSPEPVGRRLDFLLQEMGREVNTMGSKAQDLGVTGLVLDMKAELEKLREQVQNIE
jgi:uncharacterized protein (TIGR00255 family)